MADRIIVPPSIPFSSMKVEYLFTIVALAVAYFVRTHYYHGLNKIPGPFLAGLTSLWKWDVVRREKMIWVNTELHEKYGPLVRIGPNHVSASSPESIQVIHRAKGFTKVNPSSFLTVFQLWGSVLTMVSSISPAFTGSFSLNLKATTYTMSSRLKMPSTMRH